MSKKSQKLKDPDIIQHETKIIHTVDLSLKNADLVDMLVEEQSEVLEDKIVALEEKIDPLERKLETARSKLQKALDPEFKKQCKGDTTIAKKLFKGKESFEVYVSKRRYKSYTYMIYSSRRRRQKCHANLPQPNSYKGQYSVSPDKDQKIDGYYSFQQEIPKAIVEKTPEYQKVKDICDDMCKLMKQLYDAKSALSNIENMGARTKASMVRKMLQSSPQGKALLSRMPKLDAIKLLGK